MFYVFQMRNFGVMDVVGVNLGFSHPKGENLGGACFIKGSCLVLCGTTGNFSFTSSK